MPDSTCCAPKGLIKILLVIYLILPQSGIADINTGMVAHYPLDGDVLDYTGSGNNGAAFGAVSAPDRFGNADAAYVFDGLDDFLEIPHFNGANISPNGFSVSFYTRVHPQQLSGDNHYTILDKYHGPQCLGSSTGWTMTGITNHQGLLFAYGNGSAYLAAGGAQLLDDQWHHVVGTVDDTYYNLYVDGVLYDSQILQGDPVGNSGSLYIGKWGCAGSRFFRGAIDDIRVYSRVLSDQEILALYDIQAEQEPQPEEPPVEPPPIEPPQNCPAPVDDSALRPSSTAVLVIKGVTVNSETGELEIKASLDPNSAAWADLLQDPQIRVTIELQTQSEDGMDRFGLVGDVSVPLLTDGVKLQYGDVEDDSDGHVEKEHHHKKHHYKKRHNKEHDKHKHDARKKNHRLMDKHVSHHYRHD